MSSVTNICNLPTEGNSNAKLLYFFLNFKKTAIDSFVHRQVGLQCYIRGPGGFNGGSFPLGFCIHDNMIWLSCFPTSPGLY